MKILLADFGCDNPASIMRELQFAGLPTYSSVRILQFSEQITPVPSSAWQVLSRQALEPYANSSPLMAEQSEQYDQRIKHAVIKRFPTWFVESEQIEGKAADAVLQTAAAWHADLIIIGPVNRLGHSGHFEAEHIATIVAEAPCSVRIVHSLHRHHEQPLKLLFCLDGSEYSGKTIEAFTERALPRNTVVHILTVVEPAALGEQISPVLHPRLDGASQTRVEDIPKMLDYYETEMRQHYHRIESQIRYGNPSSEILRYAGAHEIDAIVLGAQGQDRLCNLGNIANTVMQKAESAVEIVR